MYFLGLKPDHSGFIRVRDSDEVDVTVVSSGQALNDGQWHHIAGVRDLNSGELRLFVDGQLAGVGNAPPGDVGDDDGDVDPIVIGARYTAAQNSRESYFDGLIDDVRIWGIARSGLDIQSDMARALNGDEPGLIGYWDLEEGAGAVVSDASTNGNEGMLGGGSSRPVFIDTSNPTPGGLLQFDGDDFVEFPHSESLDLRDTLTLETWVRVDQFPPSAAIPLIVKGHPDGLPGDMYGLYIQRTGEVLFNTNAFGSNNTIVERSTGPGVIQAGRWHHVAVAMDRLSESVTIYVDENEQDLQITNPFTVVREESIFIGTVPRDGQPVDHERFLVG